MLLIPLALSAVAGAWDAVTGEIPELITVPLIALGVVYSAITGNLLASVVVVGGTLAAGYALYYLGQLGGGDVLLLAGIGAWLPLFHGIPTPLLLFLGATFLASIYYSIFFSLMLGTREKVFRYAVIPFAFIPLPYVLPYALILYYYIGNVRRNELFTKEVHVKELRPEDVLAEEVSVLPPKRMVLSKKDIEKLKKAGIEKVKILVNLPRLGPFIFAAFLPVFLAETNAINLYAYLLSLLSFHVKLCT